MKVSKIAELSIIIIQRVNYWLNTEMKNPRRIKTQKKRKKILLIMGQKQT